MTPSAPKCLVCGYASGGWFSDLITKKYYCVRHWYAESSKLDKWLKALEDKQWGHNDWYTEAMAKKPRKGPLRRPMPVDKEVVSVAAESQQIALELKS